MTTSTTESYVAVRYDGSVTLHTSLAALRAAQRRAKGGRIIVDHWRSDDPPPFRSSDARAWDAYRNRHGYSGVR